MISITFAKVHSMAYEIRLGERSVWAVEEHVFLCWWRSLTSVGYTDGQCCSDYLYVDYPYADFPPAYSVTAKGWSL